MRRTSPSARPLAVLIASLALAVLTAGPALAQYPPTDTDATPSDSTPAAGEAFTVTGTGATPGGAVSAVLDGEVIGTGTAASDGSFSFLAEIPAGTAAGDVTITVTDELTGTTIASFTVTVTAAAGTDTDTDTDTDTVTDTDSLASTGVEDMPAMLLVAFLALAGGATLLLGRRIRSAQD